MITESDTLGFMIFCYRKSDRKGYEVSNYAMGGHRSSGILVDDGTIYVFLCEFDTTLWDCPHRFGGAHDLYFRYMWSKNFWNFRWCRSGGKTLDFAPKMQKIKPKTNRFRLQITDKGIRTRVLTLLSSLQEVASVVEYRSKKE